jgi:hypothetical protein
MPSSGLWRCVDLIIADVSEELVPSIFMVERMIELSRPTRFHIPEDGILQYKMCWL